MAVDDGGTGGRQVDRRVALAGLSAALGVGLVASTAGAAAADPRRGAGARQIVVPHPGGGAVDAAPIQVALTQAGAAGGGVVSVDAGRWELRTAPLRIYAGTRLQLAPGARLVRIGSFNKMLTNGPIDGSTSTIGGYDGPGNIIVDGGIWDVNGFANTSVAWGMVFAHASKITVLNAEILNTAKYHAIEYNAISDGSVINCRFIDAAPREDPWNLEAVSWDIARPELVPWGAGDLTPCRNIRIIGNYCTLFPQFAGCHSGGPHHENVIIANNTVENLSWWAVGCYSSRNVVISNNVINGTGGGVWVRSPVGASATVPVENLVITGNVIDGCSNNEGIRIDARDQGDIGLSVVTGNTIRSCQKNGMLLQHVPGIRVTGNTVLSSAGTGVRMEYSPRATLSDNLLQDVATAAVTVSSSADIRIHHNTIVDCAAADPTSSGIHLVGAPRADVTFNTVRGKDATHRPQQALYADVASTAIRHTGNDFRDGYVTAAVVVPADAVDTPDDLI